MKIYAHHDLSGEVHSLVLYTAPKGAGVMLTPRRGLLVSELGGLRVKDPKDFKAVRALAEGRRVHVNVAEHSVPNKT